MRKIEDGGDYALHAAFDFSWCGQGSDQIWQLEALFDDDSNPCSSRFT